MEIVCLIWIAFLRSTKQSSVSSGVIQIGITTMRMKFLAPATAAAGALAFGLAMTTPATAAPGDFLGGCALTDLTSPNADGCQGFYEGNVLNDSPTDLAIQTSALAALGLAWDGTLEEAQLSLNSQTIDFDTLLNGVTYIGIHWGRGEGPVDVEGAFHGEVVIRQGSEVERLRILTGRFM